MFDKNSSFQPSNKSSDQTRAPLQAVDQEKENKEQEVEDIFSSKNSDEKTGAITEEQKKMAANVLSPDTGTNNNPHINNNNNSNMNRDKFSHKLNKKILFITLILFIILCLSVVATWYYINYIQEKTKNIDNANSNKNVILNQNQNNNSKKNNNKKNLSDIIKEEAMKNKNKNINKNANLANQDSDFDGLSDEEEKKLGTNIHMADTDNDGLLDKEEVKIYHTNPLKADTDGDGYSDGEEIKKGYNPNGKGKLPSPLMPPTM